MENRTSLSGPSYSAKGSPRTKRERKDLCVDRPRERLERVGLESLSDAELVALLVRTGMHDVDALSLSQNLLSEVGGLHGLAELSLAELAAQPGLGIAKSASLLAAREIGCRLAESRLDRGTPIGSPEDVHRHFSQRMRWCRQEHFMVLLLDGRNCVMRQSRISQGTLNASLVHPREVFRCAVREAAAALVLVHNHPSGDPTPSREDLEITDRLVEAGRVLGIRVLDHVVIAEGRFYSFRERGQLA